ncbi:MAG: phosphatase [Chloroflexi bacterium HGW-Chloroflexi-6]|nr:MAG: phosphatase [Chloroflexi bacterium HGW-Chloroflexi-6]
MNITNLTILNDSLWTSGQPTRAELAEVAAAGFEVVINLAMSTSDNALPDEAELVQSLGMEYIHIPVVWEAPQPGDLLRFMDAMDTRFNRKVLVHCALNYRASAFTALWRVLRQGWEKEKAFAVQETIWQLDDYPIWKNFVTSALGRNY